jgi:cellulose synthase/poly-beta-1,6-N-acetylglucosamine synthase-like glycosyltransferase
MVELLFWAPAGILFYVYLGFPMLIVTMGSIRRKDTKAADISPSVTLVIAAFNEERHIRARIENALSLEYPAGMVEVLIASDGSTDHTVEIASEYGSRGVKVLDLPRRGKIHALNAAVAHASSDILVFSDATSMFRMDALRKIVRNFADCEVGGVSGTPCFLVGRTSQSSAGGERLYFSYDSFLKLMESRTGSVVSAAGCIYAIRRCLYRPIPAYVTDDFSISTAVIEQGYRLVWEPEAVAYEQPASESHGEFRRKVRMMTRGYRSVMLRRQLLNPFRFGMYSIVLLTHKLMRRLVPVFLIVLLGASVPAAMESPFYFLAFVLQIVFYAMALAGLCLTKRPAGRWRILAIPFFYCMANAASLVALCKVLSGCRIESWQPQRPGLAEGDEA